MGAKTSKSFKIILFAIILIVGGGSFLNWFLKNRLESFLKKTLHERVAAATDGFYDLQFSDLSIGLLDGSLYIKDIKLVPDSAVFESWSKKDSLPPTYFKIHVGSVLFDGVNLTWHFSYKKLNFRLFEVKNPIIEIYASADNGEPELESRNKVKKTLYQQISPYINQLSIREIFFDNASVKYIAKEDESLSVYALKKFRFKAYGFRLDSESYENGKLLYCDNFEFLADNEQILLANDQICLKTNKIELNTQDSIIRVDKLVLIPQKQLWVERGIIPESYVEALIDSVRLKGIGFNRKEGLNRLNASLFQISNSDIQYYNNKKNTTIKDTVTGKTELVSDASTWNLYSITGPLFNDISVGHIVLDNARFRYVDIGKDSVDAYKMERLNFEAFDFNVGSDSYVNKKFLYSQFFKLNAVHLEANVVSKNQQLDIDKLDFNSYSGFFKISGIKVAPISLTSKLNYLSGSIDSITVAGIKYKDEGLDVDYFNVTNPWVKYVKRAYYSKQEKEKTEPDKPASLQYLNSFGPSIQYLRINKISIDHATLAYMASPVGENDYYLSDFYFNATNLLLNDKTLKHSDTYVTFDNISFSFLNFDNVLPGNEYRLKIGKANFSGFGGDLLLKNVDLIPTSKNKTSKTGTLVALKSPLLNVKRINYNLFSNDRKLNIASVLIKSPEIEVDSRADSGVKSKDKSRPLGINLFLNKIDLTDAKIAYKDEVSNESFTLDTWYLALDGLNWVPDVSFWIDNIETDSTKIVFKTSDNPTKKHSSKTDTDKLIKTKFGLKQATFKNFSFALTSPNLDLSLNTDQFVINSVKKDNKSFDLGSFVIQEPTLLINQFFRDHPVDKEDTHSKQDIYKKLYALAPVINAGNISVVSGVIDYKNNLPHKNINQKLNTVDLSLRGLNINNEKRTYYLSDINFKTKNLQFPLNGGFYNLKIADMEIDKSRGLFELQDAHLEAIYPKTEFAYKQPHHKDWFDVKVSRVSLRGIDFPSYFANNLFSAKKVYIEDVMLRNYKNQKIPIEHHKMPLIYEMLFKLPVRLDMDSIDVRNFNVVYEELSKKGTEPGKIFFTDMNGRIANFNNYGRNGDKYMKLVANGKLMGTGYFDAEWTMPTDSLTDHFHLSAHLSHFDLKELNQLITPMAPAQVESGIVNQLTFSTDASSLGATIDMLFLYNDLQIKVLKDKKDGSVVENKLVSFAANAFLKKSNPDIKRGKAKAPRHAHSQIVRNPYHSTFNYFWQILEPPVVESIGISKKTENFAKGVINFFGKIKSFFKKDKKEKEHRPKDSVLQEELSPKKD